MIEMLAKEPAGAHQAVENLRKDPGSAWNIDPPT